MTITPLAPELTAADEAILVATLHPRVAKALHDQAGQDAVSSDEHRRAVEATIDAAMDEMARQRMREGLPLLSPGQEARMSRRVRDKILGLGGLQSLLEDDRIENINANGFDGVFVRYSDGTRAQVDPIAESDNELIELIQMLAARGGAEERRFDRAAPELSMQLPDGSRLFALQAVVPRPVLSIRRHRFLKVTLADLVAKAMFGKDFAAFFSAIVRARKNIIVAGRTGVGKTTFLRALASEIPFDERIITIEDSRELALEQDPAHPNCVPMQSRQANIEGQGEIGASDLVRAALRLDPDRVIVGEVRGKEVVPMLNAMSLGNDGSMATIHASDTAGVFLKLSTYAAQSEERLAPEATNLLVASAVDFVIHLGLLEDGRRTVTSVREVTGADGLQIASNEIYRPGPDGRAIAGSPMSSAMIDDLAKVGYTGDLTGWQR